MGTKKITLQKALPWILIICGTIGLACALIIMYDKIEILKDPNFRTGCDLNPIISCGSIMQSAQASAFGFPNPFIGMVGFPIVITIGMALLAGAASFKRWFWLGLQAGTIFGVIFVHWLFYQSVYNLGALCPFCVVVWIVTITTFWYVTLYNLQAGHIRLKGFMQRIGQFIIRHHLDILILWMLIIAALILKHFWYYYGHYIL